MSTADANVAIESLNLSFKRFCKARWNGSGEEVAQTAISCLLDKISKNEFEHKSLEQTDFMLKRLAKARARMICGYKYDPKKEEEEYQAEFYSIKIKGVFSTDQSFDELHAQGWEPTPARPTAPNYRLVALIPFLSPSQQGLFEVQG